MTLRALGAATMLACCAWSAPARAAADVPPTTPLAERLLLAHNRERDAVGVPRLAWSETLAAHARAWAERLARLRLLAHPADAPTDLAPEGENLWAGTRASFTPEEMVGLWLAERARFRPGRFPDVSTTRRIDDIGHYTQIIWRSTRRVGCAVADNGADEYLVCRYDEAGNVIGERPL